MTWGPRPDLSGLESPAARQSRRDLSRALGRSYAPSDEGAETDWGNIEARHGLASANVDVDDFVERNGLDPNDVWSIAKRANGENLVADLVGFRPDRLDPAYADFQRYAAAVQTDVAGKWGRSGVTGTDLVRGLGYHVDNRSAAELLGGHTRGLIFEGHGQAALAAMTLDSSLDIGGYDLNHPALLAGLLQRGDLSNVRMTLDESRFKQSDGMAFFAGRTLQEFADTLGLRLNEKRGYVGQFDPLRHQDVDSYREYSHDHSKIVVAGADFVRAGGDITAAQRAQQMLVIGSMNFTTGALGPIAQGRARFGFNMEQSFVLHGGMIGNGVTEQMFDELMRQGTSAIDFIHSREGEGILGNGARLDFSGRDFSVAGAGGYADGGLQSRVLTNRGVVLEHQRQMAKLATTGVTGQAHIFINTLGGVKGASALDNRNAFLETQVKSALANPNARVNLMYGAKFSGGADLDMETVTKDILDDFYSRLTADEQSRLTIVRDLGRGMHAKVAAFTFEGEGGVVLQGSTNYSNSSQRGSYADGIPFRDLSTALFEDEMPMIGGQIDTMRHIMGVAAIQTFARAGSSGMELERLNRRTLAKYGLASRAARMVSIGDSGYAARFAVGGIFHLGGGLRIDLGDLKVLTAVEHVDAPPGHLYVAELTKFVGPANGIGVTDPVTGKRSNAREVDALEVMMAGTAAANAQVHGILLSMARQLEGGEAALQRLLADPTRRGYLRSRMGARVRRSFENFAGVEPGAAVYDSRAYARLGFGIDGNDRMNMLDPAALGAPEMDAALTGRRGDVDLGNQDFMFAAGGLSRHRADGTRTPVRYYNMDMAQALPVGLQRRGGRGDNEYLFLLPLAKLAQLPQRLQNIMSARALAIQEDPGVMAALGVDPNRVRSLVSDSRFVGEDGKRVRGFRVKGFAIAGMAGDNAYMVGEHFEDAYVGNETWSQTVKLRKSDAVTGAPGRLFIEQIKAQAHDLGDDKWFLSHELLEQLGHRVAVSLEHQDGTQQLLQEDVLLGTEKLNRAGLIVDLQRDRGVSLVDSGSTYTFTVRGTTVRQMQSGDRSMIGGKFPFAFIQERSRALQAVRAYTRGLDPTTYKLMGFEDDLGRDVSNAIFSTKTIKTGQALVETGIEVLSSGAWEHQLRALEDAGALEDLAGTMDRLAGFASEGRGVQRQFREMANTLRGRDAAAIKQLLRTRLGRSGAYLARRSGRAISMAGDLQHMGSAILAFGLHARHSFEQAKLAAANGDQGARDFYMAFSPEYQQGVDAIAGPLPRADYEEAHKAVWNRMGTNNMPDQMLLGSTLMSFTTVASATAVAMSSRNRINLLNYHAGGYTDAFLTLMASSPELIERNLAYQELVYGGLLGRGGRHDVRFGSEFNPMTRFVAGLDVEFEGKTINPFVEVLQMQRQIRGVFGNRGASSLAGLRDLQAQRARYEALNPLVEAARTDANRPHLRSGGSTQSTLTQAHLAVLESAEIGARSLQIPRIGWLQSDGGLLVDAAASGRKAGVDLISVNLLSAAALRSLGSFEDFSPEIQSLQVKIEQMSGVLAHIQDENGVLVNRMTASQQDQYRELLDAVGVLMHVQKEAAATGLQKLMGGQLALPGRNMVVGTLPEVPHGSMVLGSAAWKVMREGASEEVMRSFQGEIEAARATFGPQLPAKRLFSDAFGRLVRSAAASAGTPESSAAAEKLVARLQSELSGENNRSAALERTEQAISGLEGRLRTLNEQKQAFFDNYTEAQRGLEGGISSQRALEKARIARRNAISGRLAVYPVVDTLEIEGLLHDRRQLRRNQRHFEGAAADYHLGSYTEWHTALDLPRISTNEVQNARQQLLVADETYQDLLYEAHAAGQLANEVDGKIKQLRGDRRRVVQAQHGQVLRLVGDVDAAEALALLRAKKSRNRARREMATAGFDAAENYVHAQLSSLRELRRAQLPARDLDVIVRGVIEEMFEDAGIRSQLMRGIFQRAGAPFGPEGLVARSIMTDTEYNAGNPALLIHQRLSQTSVFLNVHDMAYNLGDFDGDTGSVSWLKEYTFLQAKDRLYKESGGTGVPLTRLERGMLRHADEKLALSPAETLVSLGRYYTGWTDMFSNRALYIGADTELDKRFGGDIERTRAHVHALTKARDRGATLTDTQLATLRAFDQRKATLSSLAVAGNEYVAAMHEAHDEVRSYIQANSRPGFDRNQLFREFFRTSAADRALVHFEKMQAVVSDMNTKTERDGLKVDGQLKKKLENLTQNQLVTFFAMTSYAATTIIGSTFEAAYALQSEATRSRAHGLFAIHERTEALFARKEGYEQGVDPADAPTLLRTLSGGKGVNAQKAKALLAEFEVYNERHARLAGSYLVLQQMAREAIKPKSGTDQLDEIREDLKTNHWWTRGSQGANVSSGMRMANKQVRSIALDWFHTIVTGTGMLVDPTDPRSRKRLRSIDAAGNVRANGVELAGGWRQVHTEVARGFYDYHKTGVEGLRAQGALDAKNLGQLFGGHEIPYGLEAFADAEASQVRFEKLMGMSESDAKLAGDGRAWQAARTAEAAVRDAHTKAVEAGKKPDENKNRWGFAYQAALIDQYVAHRSETAAASLIEDAKAGRERREMKSAYMRALYDTPDKFSSVSSRMDVGDKLFILSQVVARGKFDVSSSGSMETAMMDVFGHFDAANAEAEAARLKKAAFKDTGNRHFAQSLANIFTHWAQGSNMTQAIAMGAQHSRLEFERESKKHQYAETMRSALLGAGETAETLEKMDVFGLARHVTHVEKLAAGRKENLGLAEDTEAGQKLLRARAHTEAAAFHDAQESSFAGGRQKGSDVNADASKGAFNPRDAHRQAVHVDKLFGQASRSHTVMGVGGALAMMGAAWAGAATPAQAAEAVGEAGAAVVALADPRVIARQTLQSTQKSETGERVALGLVTAGSLGAAMWAGQKGYEVGVRHAATVLEGAGHEMSEHVAARAGVLGIALSAVAGVAAATVASTLGTAIAQRFGYMRNINPVPEAIAQLSELAGIGASEGGGMADIDELAELGDQATVEGIVEIRDAAGDLITQEFYTFTAAAMDGDSGEDGGDASGLIEGELDTFVGAADYDASASHAVSDSLAAGNQIREDVMQ